MRVCVALKKGTTKLRHKVPLLTERYYGTIMVSDGNSTVLNIMFHGYLKALQGSILKITWYASKNITKQ